MSILKNFVNPWELNKDVLNTNVLDTNVLETSVLDNPFTKNEEEDLVFTVKGNVKYVYITINDSFYKPLFLSWKPFQISTKPLQEIDVQLSKRNAKHRIFRVIIETTKGVVQHKFNPLNNTKIEIKSNAFEPFAENLTLASDSNKDDIGKVSWGETSGLYPTISNKNLYQVGKWGAPIVYELLKARAAIEVVGGRGEKVQTYTPNLNDNIQKMLATYHLKSNLPPADGEIEDNSKVKYFYLDAKYDKRHTALNNTQKIIKSYGPFYNIGGGDVARGKCYVIFYEADN